MSANLSEKVDSIESDNNLAAVSEVEAGIRDFVRNDVAYLRRPAAGQSTTETPPLDSSADATVNNVNSLIQRVAGTSLGEIEKLISELEALRAKQGGSAPKPAGSPAGPARDRRLCATEPGRDEVDPHDRRQRRAVEEGGREPARQLERFRARRIPARAKKTP